MNAIDTNVLVYAYDDSSPAQRDVARALLAGLSDTIIPWQVACEFLNASRKKIKPGSDPMQPWARLDEILATFPLVLPTEAVLTRAQGLMRSHQLQFWDAMIYAACIEAGATRIYTQDVPGQKIAGLEVVNPFG